MFLRLDSMSSDVELIVKDCSELDDQGPPEDGVQVLRRDPEKPCAHSFRIRDSARTCVYNDF